MIEMDFKLKIPIGSVWIFEKIDLKINEGKENMIEVKRYLMIWKFTFSIWKIKMVGESGVDENFSCMFLGWPLQSIQFFSNHLHKIWVRLCPCQEEKSEP